MSPVGATKRAMIRAPTAASSSTRWAIVVALSFAFTIAFTVAIAFAVVIAFTVAITLAFFSQPPAAAVRSCLGARRGMGRRS